METLTPHMNFSNGQLNNKGGVMMLRFIERHLEQITELVIIFLICMVVLVVGFAISDIVENKPNAQLDKCITLLKETDVKNPETLCTVILDK